MPGPVLHLGATVLCAATAGRRRRRAPNPAGAGLRPAGGRRMAAPYVVAGCPFVPPGGNGPCVTAQWVVAATRVLAGGQPVVLHGQQAICAPTGTPLLPVVGADARDRELTRCTLDFPYRFDGRGRTAEAEHDDAHPRPDRAGAVHRAGRAREPARLRLRPAAARVRAEQRGARGDAAGRWCRARCSSGSAT